MHPIRESRESSNESIIETKKNTLNFRHFVALRLNYQSLPSNYLAELKDLTPRRGMFAIRNSKSVV